ncbi:MAG: RNA polymerase sigma factor [Janthinobacterium lividum]
MLPLLTASPQSAPLAADALRQALLADRAQALTRLYRQGFPPVRRYIGRRGGSAQDAQDVFQDALVILYEQATSGTLLLTASASTYLLSVSRNLWHQELRRRARLPHEVLPAAWEPAAGEEGEVLADPAFAVRDYVEQLGEKCKSLLLSFYYFQQPLTQLAETHGYRSVRSATVQKFKCLEQLRHAVRAAFRAETSPH